MDSYLEKTVEANQLVIGTGPASLGCVLGLLAQGKKVTVVDGGADLEQWRKEHKSKLASQTPENWDKKDVAGLESEAQPEIGGISVKLVHGSDYPYRRAKEIIPTEQNNSCIHHSLAFGGLSNVWGAAILPVKDQDIEDWPIKAVDLKDGYLAVAQQMQISGDKEDAIAQLFKDVPLELKPMPLSRQAKDILGRLEASRVELESKSFRFGAARLAFHRRGIDNCQLCGRCLKGCPYDLIFSSRNIFEELHQQKKIELVRDFVVEKVDQQAGKVFVYAKGLDNREQHVTFIGQRLFIGAGVLATAKIILNSHRNFLGSILTAKTNQYFLQPVFTWKSFKAVTQEKLLTSAQVFVEFVGHRMLHFQVYTYNDLFLDLFRKRLGILSKILPSLITFFVNRVVAVQGYLHSESSPVIEIFVDPKRDVICTRSIRDRSIGKAIRSALKQFRFVVKKMGGFAPSFLATPGVPGVGSHIGGTISMAANPDMKQSDIWGRMHDWDRIHIVDASTLPSIPATTLTFTVMANAYRIGHKTFET